MGCQKTPQSTTITGEIKGMKTDTLYLFDTDGVYTQIDTIYVAEGKFEHTIKIDTLTWAMLLFKDGTMYPVFLNKENEITILGSADNLGSLTITGNEANQELTAFNQSIAGLAKPSDKLLEEKAEAFIRQHHSSVVSIYLLDTYFVEKETPDLPKIKSLISLMTGTLQDKPYIEELNTYIDQAEKVAPGKIAPFFNLLNTKGERVSRAEKFKDKYLLMSFWASWAENRSTTNGELRKINKKFKKYKEFGMLGVSLDLDKEIWKESVKQDTLSWEQVCDFAGVNSEMAKQYAIRKLPTNLLIDPQGRILAWDIKGDSLTRKIEEILKK